MLSLSYLQTHIKYLDFQEDFQDLKILKLPIDSVIKKEFPTRLIIIVKSLYLPHIKHDDSQVRYLFEVLAMIFGEKIIGKFQNWSNVS